MKKVIPLSLVFLCVLAVPAFGFHLVVRTSTQLAPGATGTVTASCPSGQHAALAGVAAQFDLGAANQGVFPTNMSLSTARQVIANGQNIGTAPGSLTAVAYCDAGANPGRTTVSHTVSVAPQGGGAATATCPAHTVLVEGGFHAPAAAEILLTRLERTSATAWRVAARNFTTGAVPLTAIAYCGAGPVPQLARALAEPAVGWQPFNVTALCPAGTRLLFGGLRATNFGPGVDPIIVVPFAFAATSNQSWRVDAFAGVTGGGSVQALAYCR